MIYCLYIRFNRLIKDISIVIERTLPGARADEARAAAAAARGGGPLADDVADRLGPPGGRGHGRQRVPVQLL